jgi:hypothetical protein
MLGDYTHVEAIVESLLDKNHAIQAITLETLGVIGGQSDSVSNEGTRKIIAAIARAYKSLSASQYHRAKTMMRALAHTPYEQAIAKHLPQHPVHPVPLGAFALRAMSVLDEVPALDSLLSGLHADLPEIRIFACKVFGQAGDSQAIESMLRMCVDDSSADVRKAALASLGELMLSTPWSTQDDLRQRVLTVTEGALSDSQGTVRAEAVRSLEKLVGGPARVLLEYLLEDDDEVARQTAHDAIARLDGSQSGFSRP